jgi:hypothetical protein
VRIENTTGYTTRSLGQLVRRILAVLQREELTQAQYQRVAEIKTWGFGLSTTTSTFYRLYAHPQRVMVYGRDQEPAIVNAVVAACLAQASLSGVWTTAERIRKEHSISSLLVPQAPRTPKPPPCVQLRSKAELKLAGWQKKAHAKAKVIERAEARLTRLTAALKKHRKQLAQMTQQARLAQLRFERQLANPTLVRNNDDFGAIMWAKRKRAHDEHAPDAR